MYETKEYRTKRFPSASGLLRNMPLPPERSVATLRDSLQIQFIDEVLVNPPILVIPKIFRNVVYQRRLVPPVDEIE